MSDLISRQDAIKDVESWVAVDEHEKHLQKNVIEWLKEFPPAEHGTNLASLGTDCISREQAIDALRDYLVGKRCPDDGTLTCRLIENEVINKLPTIQPEPQYKTNYGFMWLCPKCGLPIHSDYTRCVRCGHNREKGV